MIVIMHHSLAPWSQVSRLSCSSENSLATHLRMISRSRPVIDLHACRIELVQAAYAGADHDLLHQALDECAPPLVIAVLVHGSEPFRVARHIRQEPLARRCVDLGLHLTPLGLQLVLGLEVGVPVDQPLDAVVVLVDAQGLLDLLQLAQVGLLLSSSVCLDQRALAPTLVTLNSES
jgi:hypothetical protein